MKQTSNKPLVSVAMRTYKNREFFLLTAVESVLSQTHKNVELIILNDGSTDETDNIIKDLLKRHANIIYLSNVKEKTFPEALNQILDEAKGKYVAFLNGDDYWLDKSKLEQQVDLFECDSTVTVVGGNPINVDADGKSLYIKEFPNVDNELRKQALRLNPFAYGSIMVNLKLVNQVGRFNKDLLTASDFDLWLKLGQLGKFYNFPLPWLARRMHGSNTGETKRREQIREHATIAKGYHGVYPNYYKSIFYLYVQYFILTMFGRHARHLHAAMKKIYNIQSRKNLTTKN